MRKQAHDILVIDSEAKSIFQFTHNAISRLPGHKYEVRCMILVKDTIWTGDINGRIRIWDVKTLKALPARIKKEGAITCMCLVGGRVWAGVVSEKSAIVALDAGFDYPKEIGTERKKWKVSEYNGVRKLLCVKQWVWCSYVNRTIHIRDKKGAVLVPFIENIPSCDVESWVSMTLENGATIICVAFRVTEEIYIFDTLGTRICKLEQHDSPVKCLMHHNAGEQYLLSGAYNGRIVIWRLLA